MQVIQGGTQLLPVNSRCVVTVGNFDGVHRGHQTLIAALKSKAKQHNLAATLVTFEPLSHAFFLQEKAPLRLMTLPEKQDMLQALGVDILCVLQFDAAMAALSAEAFVSTLLLRGLNMQAMIVGKDFRFGHKRLGDVSLLETLGKQYGFELIVLEPYLEAGQKISSTRIRSAYQAAEFEEVERLLGHERIKGRNEA